MSKINPLGPPRRKRFIPKYDVDGVYKVTLGEETQMQIEAVVGTHVYAQYPWKFISKAKIMESIHIGGDLSEFFPLRQQLEAYDEEEVLIGYIIDESTVTDDFYVCCTPEARNHCKQQSDKYIRRQEEKVQKSVQKKPRPWKSLGSDAEIIEQIPVNKRNLMEVEIKTKFPIENKPEKFDVSHTCSVRDGSIDLTCREKFNNFFRRRVDCESQITPALVHGVSQTEVHHKQSHT